MSADKETEKIWIIQRCLDAWQNRYEDWPGYCEKLMNRQEMPDAELAKPVIKSCFLAVLSINQREIAQ